MNKYYLQSKIRSVGIAYILFFIAGAHYAYLNRWGYQILYWITLGGLGIWFLIDLFSLSNYVRRFNAEIFDEIDYLERREQEDLDFRHLERMKEMREAEHAYRRLRDYE